MIVFIIVHYMKTRMDENAFQINLQERSCYLTEYGCFDYFFQILFVNITV